MATTTQTPEQIADQYAAAEAEAARHRAKLDAIRDAENTARHAAALEHYTDAAGDRATSYRQERDAAKKRLDELANADQVELTRLFNAFLAFKEADAKAGALRNHAAYINTLNPLGRNHAGADQSHVIHCDELHARLTWSDYLASVVAERTAGGRRAHAAELESEAGQKVIAAVEQARAEAAADTTS
jgi:hypothetical protein